MNLQYRTADLKSLNQKKAEKTSLNRSPIRPNMTNNRTKTKKSFSLPRVIFTSVIIYLIGLLALYIVGVPIVRAAADVIAGSLNPPKTTYPTFTLMIDPTVPTSLKNILTEKLDLISFEDKKKFTFVDDENSAGYVIRLAAGDAIDQEKQKVLYSSYLIPVGHIYWIKDGISLDTLKTSSLHTTEENVNSFKTILKDSFGSDVEVIGEANLNDFLSKSENNYGIIDISQLDHSFKLLTLEGKYFLDSAPEGGIAYSLIIERKNASSNSGIESAIAVSQAALPPMFEKEQVLSLNMTGVTAITRGLGIKTNNAKDGGYAARNISDFLKSTDLTHISNEISFVDNCSPAASTMRFCATNSTMQALEDIGTDIVELTGNHNNDYGSSWNTKTIEKYKEKGWDYFGGGLNATDAAKILYKEVKGTKLAFVGYNYYDTVLGTAATAASKRSGANSWSNDKIKNDMKTARDNGADVIIVTFQYQECWAYTTGNTICYGAIDSPNQTKDFRFAIDAGADIVVGTQAHQPQSYEIYNGKIIFYGLGNLFFDQIQWLGTRQGVILTHYFYQGKYYTTKLTTTIYNNDLKTFITTGAERDKLLNQIKNGR